MSLIGSIDSYYRYAIRDGSGLSWSVSGLGPQPGVVLLECRDLGLEASPLILLEREAVLQHSVDDRPVVTLHARRFVSCMAAV